MNPIKIVDNFLSKEECDEIINNYMPLYHKYRKSEGLGDGDNVSQFYIDDNEWPANFQQSIAKKAQPVIDEYLESWKVDPALYPYADMEVLQHFEYYNVAWHYDSETFYVGDRRETRAFAVLIYLNDEFEGGEIMFPLQEIENKPKTGQLLIFPTSYMFPHYTNVTFGSDRFVLRLNYFASNAHFYLDNL